MSCEGIRCSLLQAIINLFISLRYGWRLHTGSTHLSLSLSLSAPQLLTHCKASTMHTHTNAHKRWHLLLLWLPNGEMKSYFSLQITDCQSNKWICSLQWWEIDLIFGFKFIFLWAGIEIESGSLCYAGIVKMSVPTVCWVYLDLHLHAH